MLKPLKPFYMGADTHVDPTKALQKVSAYRKHGLNQPFLFKPVGSS